MLEQLPWPFSSKMLFLKPWKPKISLEKENLLSVPVWISFLHLKLHYYTAPILSKLASVVGRPLYIEI